ncbi:hypothetical protein [Streptomyces sp. NPDC020917]|uniref:hypothetical protein n=1 Tax=Streptomyces sp. NPDC020917 TaxID=3365102 RepID=UPI0037A19BAA
MKHRRIAAAAVAALAALTLGACGTGDMHDAASATPVSGTVSPSATTAAPVPTPTTGAPVTTSPTAVPPATHSARPTRPATTAAAPAHRTTAPARTHPTTRPPAPRTSAPAHTAVCSIRSSAGNCYKAGQFCRSSDVGLSTTDAQGRKITCGEVSGRNHWHY